jgi:hypothetical protein
MGHTLLPRSRRSTTSRERHTFTFSSANNCVAFCVIAQRWWLAGESGERLQSVLPQLTLRPATVRRAGGVREATRPLDAVVSLSEGVAIITLVL